MDQTPHHNSPKVTNIETKRRSRAQPPQPPGPPEPPDPPDRSKRWPRWDRLHPGALVLSAGIALVVSTGALVVYYVKPYAAISEPSPVSDLSADPTAYPSGSTYETAAGETQSHKLEDGSVLSLGAQSKVHVNYTPQRRFVHQVHGEVTFDIAPDSRPFVVSTFLLELSGGNKYSVLVDTSVTVEAHEGTVKIKPRASKFGTSIEVKPGTRYRAPIGALRPVLAGSLQRMHECGA